MEEIINQLEINFDENFSILNYLLNILICTGLLYFLSIIYVKYGRSISNRSQLSKVLILVGITTFIIISIVKSSLALSLGLVGALSIVRFRTAIKEPEELAYFFIAISIGLGLGAFQILPTVIGYFILIFVIIFLSKKGIGNSLSQTLIISTKCNNSEKSELSKSISNIVMNVSDQVDLKRMKYSSDRIDFNFLISVSSLEKIKKINDDLIQLKDDVDITFIDSEV